MSRSMDPVRAPRRLVLWLGIAAGLALFIAANAHLYIVSQRSQPDCVAHARLGERDGRPAAARSACAPR